MTNDEELPPDGAEGALESQPGADALPFSDLKAPSPLPSAPPLGARILAFGSILLGGLLGALIGYGTAELLTQSELWAALGAVVGATIGAVGVGIVASLTLRAMNEWRTVQHPEAVRQSRSGPIAGTRDDIDNEAKRG